MKIRTHMSNTDCLEIVQCPGCWQFDDDFAVISNGDGEDYCVLCANCIHDMGAAIIAKRDASQTSKA